MPNWKTYESSVRLLSAILAAHPDLKLNYAGTFKSVFSVSLFIISPYPLMIPSTLPFNPSLQLFHSIPLFNPP